MKKVIALGVALVFALGTAGFAVAQDKKAEDKKTDAKAADTKMDKKAEKKPAVKSANGTVKSAGADSLVVSGKDKAGKEAEWTFAIDAKTSIKKAGKAITAADVKAGDGVQVKYTEADGKAMAQAVSVKAALRAQEDGREEAEAKPAEKK